MKKVGAVIRRGRVSEVEDALEELGIAEFALQEVTETVRTSEPTAYLSGSGQFAYVPRVRLELVVDDSQAMVVAETIAKNAATGLGEDGRVMVTALQETFGFGQNSSRF